MVSEAKVETYRGLVLGVGTVKGVKGQDGKFRLGIKGEDERWYGRFGNAEDLENLKTDALEAKKEKRNVVFDYTKDGLWFNITEILSLHSIIPDQLPLASEKKAAKKTGDISKVRVKQMTGCLGDAEKAYRDGLVAQKSLTDIDYRNIRAIAACFYIEENRRN